MQKSPYLCSVKTNKDARKNGKDNIIKVGAEMTQPL